MSGWDDDRVELSGNDEGRTGRLRNVLVYITALADQSYRGITKIVALHDHKGVLVVTWAKKPRVFDMSVVQKAWGSRYGDTDSTIEHEVAAEHPVCSCCGDRRVRA